MPIVEAKKLTKLFEKITAVEGLSITVEKGEVLGLLGPNGAGKTTTIRMLAGIIAPTAGTATVAGINVQAGVELLHERIGLLTESPGFYEKLSALENLRFFARFYPEIQIEKQVVKYLELMGLAERAKDKVSSFSKGMKQRLALARALVHEPEVIFLDEPTAGLDPEAAREVRDLVQNLKSQGRTIFLCTHNLEEAEELSDRIALFKTHLVAVDTAKNLRQRLFHRQIIIELADSDPGAAEVIKKLRFVRNVSAEQTRLIVELDDFDKNRSVLVEAIVKSGGKIASVYESEHSLEDVYFTLLNEPEKSPRSGHNKKRRHESQV